MNQGEEFRNDTRARFLAVDAQNINPATSLVSARNLSSDELAPWVRVSNLRSAGAVLQTVLALTLLLALAGYASTRASIADGWGVLFLSLLFLSLLLIGIQQHALFVLAHDAAHYRMFSNRMANDIAGRIIGMAGGISMCTYRVIHRLHHNHLYSDLDPDIALHGGYPRGKAYLIKKLLTDLSGQTAYKTFGYFFGNPAINNNTQTSLRPLDDTSDKLRKTARQDRIGVVIFHLLLLATVSFMWGWRGVAWLVLLWWLPLMTVLQAILRLRAIVEHGAVLDTTSPLTAARTNLSNVFVRFVFFPHHVNYHIEHHLYPAVPHYYLPHLHRLLNQHGALKSAAVQPFAQTVRQIFAPRRVVQSTSKTV